MSSEGIADVVIRSATAADQPAIKTIVRAAQIYPLGLNWQRFVVAEECGRIVGVGQIKPHRDGSRELASIAVIPERQGRGIAGAIIQTLLARENDTLYLMCRQEMESYYVRFGFRRLEVDEMPPYFRRMYRLVQGIRRVATLFVPDEMHIAIMKRSSMNG